MIRLNRALSVLSNISATSGMSSSLYRSRLHRRTNVSSLSRSTAIQKPDQAEVQYSSLASTVALKTSFMDVLDRPCWRSTRSTYSRRVHVSSSLLTWSAAVILSLMTTPSVVSCLTLSIPRHTAGSCVEFPRLPLAGKIISFVFVRFKLRLQPCVICELEKDKSGVVVGEGECGDIVLWLLAKDSEVSISYLRRKKRDSLYIEYRKVMVNRMYGVVSDCFLFAKVACGCQMIRRLDWSRSVFGCEDMLWYRFRKDLKRGPVESRACVLKTNILERQQR